MPIHTAHSREAKLTEQEIAAARTEANELIERGEVSKAKLGREASISSSALSQFLANKYTGRNEVVAGKLRAWLETYYRRAEAEDHLLPRPRFQLTRTAERIMDAITYAHHARDVVLIHGGAGTGKTKTAKEYRDNNSGVCLATMTGAHTTVATVLREVGNCYGVRRRTDTAALFDQICSVLRERQGLLIIDEAQHLSTRALDVIRQIHDAAECGLVFAGNDEVYTNMSASRDAVYLDRLASRVGMRINVQDVKRADSATMLDAWKIKDKAVRELLQSVADKPGGLRKMDKVIRAAHLYADDERVRKASDLTEEDIRHAWTTLEEDER